MPDRRQDLSLIVALVTVVVWGCNFSLQKYLFDRLTPAGFLFLRYMIMPACAVALLAARYGRRQPRLTRHDLLQLAWLGFVGHFLHVGMVCYAVHWSTAFSSSLLLACGPIFTLVILRVMGVERMTRPQVLGVAIACAGVLVFLSEKLIGGQWRASGGDLFLLFAASIFSYYTVVAKPLVQRHGAVVVMAYATMLGAVPLVIFTLPVGLTAPWQVLDAIGWLGLLWSVVVSAFIGWLAWAWVNAIRGVARTAPLQYLMPPVAGVIAWFASGERFGTLKILGAVVTLAGVAVAQFAGGAPREAEAPIE